MKSNKRVLTVSRGLREAAKKYGPVPRILLEGRYLENAGFGIGGKIEMTVELNKLIIIVGDKYQDERNHRELLDLSTVDPLGVVAQYKDRNGIWRKEVLKTRKVGEYYEIAAVPFRVTAVAIGDKIKVDEEFGHLFFSYVFQSGGQQTIQVQILDDWIYAERLLQAVHIYGGSAVCRPGRFVSISVPKTLPYEKLFRILDYGTRNRLWIYRKSSA